MNRRVARRWLGVRLLAGAAALLGLAAAGAPSAAAAVPPTSSTSSPSPSPTSSPSPSPTSSAVATTCTAQAHVDARWGSGEAWAGGVLSVTVRNTSTTALTGWRAGWTLGTGQQVVSRWGATVTAGGAQVSAVNLAYNGALAPGATATFGVQLSGAVPEQAPSVTCTTGVVGSDRVAVTVTRADDAQTVVLRVGDLLVGAFGASDVPPTVTGDAIAPVSISGGYPTRQPLQAVYRGAAVGSAVLTTHDDVDCNHTPPLCGSPSVLFTLNVTVIPADSPVPQQHRVVLASLSSSGTTVALHVGDTLHVMIPDAYRQPTTAGTALVLREPATGGYPTGRVMDAYYTAVATGTQDVRSLTDHDCLHAQPPCTIPQQLWVVHVAVSP